jgi:hypothetical protein
VAHGEQRARIGGLLVDQVEQVLGARVVEPLLEAHGVLTGRRLPEDGAHLFPGLAGAPRRGTQHPVRRNAAREQPPAGRADIAAATGGQRALNVVDPWLARRLGVPQYQERAPAVHRRHLPGA